MYQGFTASTENDRNRWALMQQRARKIAKASQRPATKSAGRFGHNHR